MKPILYNYWRSSCSWRVRIALEMKNVDYEYRSINLIKDGGEQYSEEFSKLNPLKQVPALVVGAGERQEVIVQSLAILEYLEEVYPEPRLLPLDPVLKAKVRAICETISSGIQPLQNLETMKKVKEFGRDPIEEWNKYFIDLKFTQLEQMLAQTAGTCCVGDVVTMADLCLVPQLANGYRYGVDMSKFTLLEKLNSHLLELPAFKSSHPDNQPDAVRN